MYYAILISIDIHIYMPLTIKRTNSTSIATKSVLFNGSNQYLSVANNAAFNFGTGSFTVECWFYATANVSSQQCLITNYGGPSAGWAIQITSGVIGANLYGDGFAISGGSPAINTWYHVALSGAQGSIKLFLNGVQIGSTYTGAVSMNTSAATTIGNIINTAHMAGYISNVRVVKGTALYTASFTAPTSPLTAIANTSLLACQSATIIDNSSNNFTINNNGAATVSSITPTFVAPINNFQFARRTSTAVANSVLFNGSNQYLSVGSVANWAFLNNGSTPFTIEAWVNPTSVSAGTGCMIVSTTGYQAQIGFYFQIGNYNNGDVLFAICDGRSKINQWATSDNFLTANAWTHVAVSFTPNGTNVPSATVKFFVNGILATSSNVYTRTTTYSTSNPTNTLLVGAYQTPLGGYFPGYISNLRILNGTALYTSSFTVPTSPLTAIANTALLTCNSATIVDNSTNNFTITNNNTATVSSISPFVVSGGGMSLKQAFAGPNPYMIATGGDLITTSGSYKIHTFTTVGTSSFTISSIDSNPSIEYLVVGGGGGGGYAAGAYDSRGGGGGAGGFRTGSISSGFTNGTYSIVVGSGGSLNNNGQDSSFLTVTSLGGGGGGFGSTAAKTGGSGGGGGAVGGAGNYAGAAGTAGQGNSGGGGGTDSATYRFSGGGGGAGSAGVTAVNSSTACVGGSGSYSNITGTNTPYAGGGGGAYHVGGIGGGGAGMVTGSANTGGGGGGGYTTYQYVNYPGGTGGSGIVIIKYRYTA